MLRGHGEMEFRAERAAEEIPWRRKVHGGSKGSCSGGIRNAPETDPTTGEVLICERWAGSR